MQSDKDRFIKYASQLYGDGAILNRSDVQKVVDEYQLSYPYWFVSSSDFRADRGKYKLPSENGSSPQALQGAGDATGEAIEMITNPLDKATPSPKLNPDVTLLRMARLQDESEITIPEHDGLYIPFGFYNDLVKIFDSKIFAPVMITGLSGNGKTKMVLQAAHAAKRPLIRTNVSVETDQTDLLGGPILVNGNIVNRDGPVILAMKHGAILLLDEIDRGSNKLLCLQSIMEGEPYFNKNTGETINPKRGFQIVATANTKGKGSQDGRYLAQILDDAFLERFPITIEQDYPTETTETKILQAVFDAMNVDDIPFINNLVAWAKGTRKQCADGSIDELISTRRLVDVCQTFGIFQDKLKAITLCTNRFDDATRMSMIEYYKKIDASVHAEVPEPAASNPSNADIWFEEAERIT